MVKVKSETQIKKNYEDSTTLVPARFEAGVKDATWKDEALAGQDLYVTKMSMPDILARRAAGIERVSNETWRTDTITKGKGVIGARMKQASGKQVAGFRPYREALIATDLPPREADGMANLINRAGAVVKAMMDKKAELSS